MPATATINEKRLANVRARLALAGIELLNVGGVYRLRKWALTRDLATLNDVEVYAATLQPRGRYALAR